MVRGRERDRLIRGRVGGKLDLLGALLDILEANSFMSISKSQEIFQRLRPTN